MESLSRVNSDSSFILSVAGHRLLIDPWLTLTPEVDGHELFNSAEHDSSRPPLSIEELGRIDAIIISMPFSDHCHELTLEQLDSTIPILAVGAAKIRLMAHCTLRHRSIVIIPDNQLLNWNDIFQIAHLPSTQLLDYTHNGILITCRNSRKECLFYAPHGFRAEQIEQSSLLKTYNGGSVDLLLTTFTHYRLPLLLGSDVNLGISNAVDLLRILQVSVVVDAHSGNKSSSGLVPLFAQASRPSDDEIAAEIAATISGTKYVCLLDYNAHPEVFVADRSGAVQDATGKRKSATDTKKRKKKKIWSQHH